MTFGSWLYTTNKIIMLTDIERGHKLKTGHYYSNNVECYDRFFSYINKNKRDKKFGMR